MVLGIRAKLILEYKVGRHQRAAELLLKQRSVAQLLFVFAVDVEFAFHQQPNVKPVFPLWGELEAILDLHGLELPHPPLFQTLDTAQ